MLYQIENKIIVDGYKSVYRIVDDLMLVFSWFTQRPKIPQSECKDSFCDLCVSLRAFAWNFGEQLLTFNS